MTTERVLRELILCWAVLAALTPSTQAAITAVVVVAVLCWVGIVQTA